MLSIRKKWPPNDLNPWLSWCPGNFVMIMSLDGLPNRPTDATNCHFFWEIKAFLKQDCVALHPGKKLLGSHEIVSASVTGAVLMAPNSPTWKGTL